MAGAQEDFSAESTLAPLDRANTVDPDAKARAEAAGVTDAAKIAYAEALAVYESRSDIEPLADRRARDNADTFAATDFVRESGTGAAAWTATTAYATGDYVTLTNGDVLKVTDDGGTSGASEPASPNNVGGTVTDGDIEWTRVV